MDFVIIIPHQSGDQTNNKFIFIIIPVLCVHCKCPEQWMSRNQVFDEHVVVQTLTDTL